MTTSPKANSPNHFCCSGGNQRGESQVAYISAERHWTFVNAPLNFRWSAPLGALRRQRYVEKKMFAVGTFQAA